MMQPQRNLLDEILTHCNRGNCPDANWPDNNGDYWPLSPLRVDNNFGSFSVGPKGYCDFASGEKGSLKDLASKLNLTVTVARLQGCPKDTYPISLQAYADAKHLDADFLESVHVTDKKYFGRAAIRMAYLDETGQEVAVRWRLAMTGEDRFKWNKGSKLTPYGRWRLDMAAKVGRVWLVEGESDTHTLWSYGEPALGIPGANTWKDEWADYLPPEIEVYIWQEPDKGGTTLVSKVAKSVPHAKIIYPPQGRKDISECHILGDDIPTLLDQLASNAIPISEILSKAQNKETVGLRRKANRLLSCPSVLDEYQKLCKSMGLVGEERNAQLIYLALTSRLLSKPVSVAVKGPSSGGKSFTVETVLQAFPEEAYLDFTSMSDHALVYDDRPIDYRFIVLYEASGLGREKAGEVNNLAYMLRSLLSEGCIKYTTVEKTEEGLQPRIIEREGPTGLLVTTTWSSLHPENETRMLSITVRDDIEQTKGVFKALADRANGHVGKAPDLTEWHALQSWLQLSGNRDVTIPFAHHIAELAEPSAVRLRRDFSKVISLIQSHTILNQTHRDKDAQGRIIATMEDYRTIHNLVADLLNEGVQASVSPLVRETVDAVTRLTDKTLAPVKMVQVAKELKLDKSAASRRIRVALDEGYIVNQETNRYKAMQLIVGDPMPDEMPVLPTPDTLMQSCNPTGDSETYSRQDKDQQEGKNIDTQSSEQPCNHATVTVKPWADGPTKASPSKSRIQELIDAGYSVADAMITAVREAQAQGEM